MQGIMSFLSFAATNYHILTVIEVTMFMKE